MAIEIHGTIKPKNSGGFPIVEARDVLMPDGTRLSQLQGGGGVSSWNDLTDKPFYVETFSDECSLDTLPEVYFQVLDEKFYKVFDLTPTIHQYLSGTMVMNTGENIYTGTVAESANISELNDQVYHDAGTGMLVARTAGSITDGEITADIPEPGIYMVLEGAIAGASLALSYDVIKKIDYRVLPDGEAITSQTDVFPEQELTSVLEDEAENTYVIPLASDTIPLTAGEQYTVVWDGATYECTAVDLSSDVGISGAAYLGDPSADTGNYPFCFIYFPGDSQGIFCHSDTVATTHTVRVCHVAAATGPALLPTVTARDNGKLIAVVDGKWTAVAVADSPVAAFVDAYINEALGGDY